MTQNIGGQPILILPEGAQRLLGRDAQRANIAVAKAVANAVKSTLGPKGMDKMLVDDLGDIVITNDGATILEEMSVEHPAGKMMVEVAKTQDAEVGDGTTTAVVLAGELLKNAEDLLDKKIHSSVIVRGYNMAARKAQEILDQVATRIDFNDDETLKNLAIIAMTGKSAERLGPKFSEIAVHAVKGVADVVGDEVTIDKDYIKIEKKKGGDTEDAELIRGVVIDKERVHSGMPRQVMNAKVALVDSAMEVKETETDAEIRITSPDQLQAFLDQEEKMLRDQVECVKAAGATVLFCQKGIDDMAQHFLSKAGIFAVRRVKKSDMEKLARATGATVVTNLKELTNEDLGFAGKVTEKKVAGDDMVFIEDCKEPKSVTILLRGGSEHVLDEVERALIDSIGVVSSALIDKKIVVGGGAIEVTLALALSDYAKTVGGREQLAITAFADALEVVPRTLAESAGMDPIDTLVGIRAKHEQGQKSFGVDVMNAKLADLKEKNVIEPAKIKQQAIASASEVAEMILRIDDIIAASKSAGGAPGGMPPGMPPGMGMGM